MKAKVTEIISGQKYTDGERRITLRFIEADRSFNDIRISVEKLGLGELQLDQEVEVSVSSGVFVRVQP